MVRDVKKIMKSSSLTSFLFQVFRSTSHKASTTRPNLNFLQRYYHNNSLSMSTIRPSRDDIQWTQSLTTTPVACSSIESDGNGFPPQVERVSVLSWNILAQCLFEGNTDYAHVAQDAPVSWPERFAEILRELVERDADVLCLQEVTKDGFERDLLPSLQRQGYDGIMQRDRNWGVATFWKTRRFSLRESAHRSRTMIATLRHRGADDETVDGNGDIAILGVVNCHLQGAPDASVARVRQLHTALHQLRTRLSHHRLVVCGDMNCPLPDSACTTYLSGGDLSQDVHEWGREMTFPRKRIPPRHGYDLRSAYPVDLVRNDPCEHVTFVNRPGRCVVALDQIWVHRNKNDDGDGDVEVVGLARPFSSLEQRRRILASGLPSHVHPSDHLPVGCVLEWNKNVPFVDLCAADRAQVTECVLTAEEMVSKAMELIRTCPLEDERDRVELEYIVAPVSGLQKKIRPTTEQIDQLKDKRIKKKTLFEKVSEDTRSVIEKATRLLKEADKLSKCKPI